MKERTRSLLLVSCVKSVAAGFGLYIIFFILLIFIGPMFIPGLFAYIFIYLGLPVFTLIFLFVYFIRYKIGGLALLNLLLIPIMMFFVGILLIQLYSYIATQYTIYRFHQYPELTGARYMVTDSGSWLTTTIEDGYTVVFWNKSLEHLERQESPVLPYSVNGCNVYTGGEGRLTQKYYSIIESVENAANIYDELWEGNPECKERNPEYIPMTTPSENNFQ